MASAEALPAIVLATTVVAGIIMIRSEQRQARLLEQQRRLRQAAEEVFETVAGAYVLTWCESELAAEWFGSRQLERATRKKDTVAFALVLAVKLLRTLRDGEARGATVRTPGGSYQKEKEFQERVLLALTGNARTSGDWMLRPDDLDAFLRRYTADKINTLLADVRRSQ